MSYKAGEGGLGSHLKELKEPSRAGRSRRDWPSTMAASPHWEESQWPG